MTVRPRSPIRAGLALLITAWIASTGCHDLSIPLALAPEPSPVVRMASPEAEEDTSGLVLGPRSIVEWSAEATKGPAVPAVHGKVAVASDGRIDLGPYGKVSVNGLTAQQASDALAKHLARYIKNPRVRVTARIPTDAAAPAPVQPAAHTTPRPPAHRIVPAGGEVRPQPPAPRPGTSRKPAAAPRPGAAERIKAVPQTKSPEPPGPVQRVSFQTPAGPSLFAADKVDDRLTQPDNKDAANDREEQAPPPTPLAAPVEHAVAEVEPCGPPPTELSKQALPPYVIEPPDILAVQYPLDPAVETLPQAINFSALVRPDGTISLGIYGDVFVSGMTLDQARLAIGAKLKERFKFDPKKLNVDVLQFNSKFYYVITDYAGNGQDVERLPVTGNETVLDAISQIQLRGLSPVSSKKIFVARRAPGPGSHSQVMQVDWHGITKKGGTDSNFQLLPGDRIYVCSDPFRYANTLLDKVITPLERLMGFTLLTSQTINSIRTNPNRRGGSGTGGTGGTF
jgi:protein involved in polysaccharide export with SLBB domain